MSKIDNSGYILVDFSKVDHNKRTQVIDGFYSDCEKLISNEKFVLLSNVNEVSTTPIPSIVLFKNSIYNVITFEYVYTISAGDVVVVTKNEGGITVDVIDDSIIALNKTWSSSKINEMLPDNAGQITYDNSVSHLQSNRVQSAIDELVTIVNGVDSRVTITETDISNIKNQLITIGNEVSALHDSNNIIYEGVTTVNEAITALDNNKQDILTAGNNISISTNSVISAVDTTYTAGNNVSISLENVISAIDTTYGAGAGLSLTGNVFSVDPSTAGIKAADVEYSSGVSVADKIDSLDFEEGTSGTLATGLRKYRKWADGTLEEWARQESTESVSCTQWGGLYSWDANGIGGTSPIPFVSTDFVSGSLLIGALNGFGTLRPDAVNYIFVRGTAASGNYTVTRYRYQRGRWKA